MRCQRGPLGHLPMRRQHPVVRAVVCPWQTVNSKPPTSRAERYLCGLDVASAITEDMPGCESSDSVKMKNLEAEPPQHYPLATAEKKGPIQGQMIEYPAEEDVWSHMTTKEKRKLWLKRRVLGEFYFRCEFKGLVQSVMESPGWKPACPPRVSDEGFGTPYVEGLEKSQDTIHSTKLQGNSGGDRSEFLGQDACEIDQGGNVVGFHWNEAPTPTDAKERPDIDYVSSGREQQWDVHWSYTKWAVETMRFARKLAPWQRVNHFRNSSELCRKDLMLKNLKKRRAQLTSQGEHTEANAYNFFPVSFEMSKDYALFVEAFKKLGGTWIMKPSGAAEGRGIFLISKLSDVRAWAKPHLSVTCEDPANPGSFMVQRYISDPYIIGGKKFDLRLYALVTSFRPTTVYLYRDGFAKFSSTRYSSDPAQLRDESMHLTNLAVQRRGAAPAKKWSIKKFKLYLTMQHGRSATEKLFWEIRALIVRTLQAAERLIIHDKQSFELFGYDVIVDENQRPWLLEVDASPSLGVSDQDDLRLKTQLVGDVFDVVDVEGRVPRGSRLRQHVGGFDLAFHGGHVEIQPGDCGHSSLFGAVIKNPEAQIRPYRIDKGNFSAFPPPGPVSSAQRKQAQSPKPAGSSSEEEAFEVALRPDILMFYPEEYWRGMVDYAPWMRGEESVDCQPLTGGQEKKVSLKGDELRCRGIVPVLSKRSKHAICLEDSGNMGAAVRTKIRSLSAGRQVNHRMGAICESMGCSCPCDAIGRDVGTSVENLTRAQEDGNPTKGSAMLLRRNVEDILHGVLDKIVKIGEARLTLLAARRESHPS